MYAGFLPTIKDTVIRGKTFYSPIFWIFDEPPKNMTDAQVIEEPKGLVIVNNTKYDPFFSSFIIHKLVLMHMLTTEGSGTRRATA